MCHHMMLIICYFSTSSCGKDGCLGIVQQLFVGGSPNCHPLSTDGGRKADMWHFLLSSLVLQRMSHLAVLVP
jgi:hypothetical protein